MSDAKLSIRLATHSDGLGQAQYLVTLERNHAALQTEMIDLRQRRKETEANERASKDVERALREEIRTLQDQLDRSRRDME